MLHRASCNIDFFEWLDTLTDEEHHDVWQAVMRAAEELGCRVDENSLIPHNLFDLQTHTPSVPLLN